MLPPAPRDTVRRGALMRLACGAVAMASVAGLLLTGFASGSSDAATAVDSSLTVKWTGDAGAAASVQPARDPAGFEYGEFKNISVTVAQTQNLIDQAVRINVSGFAGGTQSAKDGIGQIWTTAANYVQAMQCWGDPASPTFRQSCEWGGRFVRNNGLGYSVYSDNIYRVASKDMPPNAANPTDVPFVTRDNLSYTGRQVLDSSGAKTYPLLDEFGPDTSNEIQGALIKSDGTGSFDFEMQSDIQAPALGCGRKDDLKCWLVLVPRGTIYGGHDATCSSIFDAAGNPYQYGQASPIQAGSPLAPGCDYWNNRIVVPLQFNQVAGTCPSGAEQRVIGSQLVISAMSSWQPALCAAGKTFSFVSNPDPVARAQLLEQKSALAFTSYPIVKEQLENPDDQAAFTQTQVAYAPVAIGAMTVSFLADGRNGQIDSMVLSPRLLAKLLTQSYLFELPAAATDPGDDDYAQLGTVNRSYAYLFQDPDFQKLNLNWGDFVPTVPSLVLPGPAGGDAIAQVWKWIQSDTDAAAFLAGKADPWGMTINPSYLPLGNSSAQVPQFDLTTGALLPTKKAVGLSNLDGSPMSLATASIDNFIKADGAEVPHKLGVERSRFDSIQASPYVDDFVRAAVTTFRANPGARVSWDPTAITDDGAGDWVSGGPQTPGQRFVIAITDAAATQRYDLNAVGLRAANGTAVTRPDAVTMAAAVSTGLTVTSNPAVKQINPAKVGAAGYPLTTVVYAAVNLTAADAPTRTALSKALAYIAGDGQKSGTQTGQLPAGYLPLTSELVSQTTAAATAIANYTPGGSSDDGPNAFTGNLSGGGSSDLSDGAGSTPSSGPQISATGATKAGLTPASSTAPLGQAGLAIALALGLLGAVFAPLLFRGRGRA